MIASFALRLVCGMSLMWALMPRRDVSAGFFRIQMLVTLGLCVLAALTVTSASGSAPMSTAAARGSAHRANAPMKAAHPQDGDSVADSPRHQSALRWLCIAGAVSAFLGSTFWTLEKRRLGAAAGLLLLVLAATALTMLALSANGRHLAQACWAIAVEGTSAALLGSAVTGMLLGHWYLTAPTMSLAPLIRLNHLFGGAALLRVVTASSVWGHLPAATGSLVWTWLALRWMAGLLAPLVLCWMVKRVLNYRNTQAATGILFVGVIVTFIGELVSVLLAREIGVPL